MTIIERKTRETDIRLELVRGSGQARVATTVPFLDHMMVTFARFSGLDMELRASGDLRHHLVEDVAIAVGLAVAELTPASAARFGERTVPMDDALVQACLDLSGRGYYDGRVPSALYNHWLRSFAENARLTLHIRVLRGADRHHLVEASFKALGLALRDALRERQDGMAFSTKGSVNIGVRP